MKRHLRLVESYGEYLERKKKTYLDAIFAEADKEKEKEIELAWQIHLSENNERKEVA
jgi:hypothetical protein